MGDVYGVSGWFSNLVCQSLTTFAILAALWYLVRFLVWKPKQKQREMIDLIKSKEGVEIPLPSGSQLPSAEYLGNYLDPSRVMYYREVYTSKYKSQRLKIAVLTLLAYFCLGLLLYMFSEAFLQPRGYSLAPATLASIAPATVRQPTPVLVIVATNPQVPARTQIPSTAYMPLTTETIMAGFNCIEWNNLTLADEGKELCVYGKLADIVVDIPTPQEHCHTKTVGGGKWRNSDQGIENEVCETWVPYSTTYWYFINQRFPSAPYIYNPDTPYPIGSCIWVKGQIGFDAEGAPTLTGRGIYDLCSSPP